MENTLDLLEALEHIDPAGLSYQDWVAVGMGLKEAGYSASDWEDWSRRDGKRYHPGSACANGRASPGMRSRSLAARSSRWPWTWAGGLRPLSPAMN